jgi:hypothetical protein
MRLIRIFPQGTAPLATVHKYTNPPHLRRLPYGHLRGYQSIPQCVMRWV